ncbi:MAG: 4-hydroxy-3-methylbut-2-enyl diphosphate reductase [Sarcina sp.]
MKREVILAENAGFCFGVKRAVDESLKARDEKGEKIYTLGPLIHNKDVVNDLESKEITAISLTDINNLNKEDVVVIRSHGVKENIIATLNNNGLVVNNATCPYVTNIHLKVKEYYAKGYQIVILGDKDHPEVVGINGWCQDTAIVTTAENVNITNFPKKVCVVSQTTEKKANWDAVLSKIVSEVKELVAFNTICAATDERQESAEDVSKKADMVVVIGGKNSSNTTKLFEICKKFCPKTYHIENAKDLTDEIINYDCKVVAVTAGASTPDYIINEVISILENN